MDMCLCYQVDVIVRTAAEDDFVICRNARMDMCLCYQVDVYCVLQLKMTLLKRLISAENNLQYLLVEV